MDNTNAKEILDGFKDYLAGSMAELTAESYTNDAKLMLATIGNDLSNMSHATVKRYVEYGGHEERSCPATQVKHRAAINAFVKYLRSEHPEIALPTNICAKIKTQRLGRRLPECLSADEISRLLDATGDGNSPNGEDFTPIGLRNRTMAEFMYASGLRVDELVHMRIGDISLGEGCGKARIVGKGNKERIVLLGERAMRWFDAYAKRARKYLTDDSSVNALAFVSCNGKPLGRMEVWRFLNKAAVKAGIEPKRVHPHVLRHSFATHLLGGGANLMVIKELMGHASIATTQVYLTVNDKDKTDAYLKAFPKLG